MTAFSDLNTDSQHFVARLGAANGLAPESTWSHLLNPTTRGTAWRPRVEVEGGALTRVHLGSSPVVNLKRKCVEYYGYDRLHKVPGQIVLPSCYELFVVGECQFSEESVAIEGEVMGALHLHGQRTMKVLSIPSTIQRLELLGSVGLERVDVSGAPGLRYLELFENKALRGGIVCYDVQLELVAGLKRKKKSIDLAALRTADSAFLRACFRARPSSVDAAIIYAHPECPVDLVLDIYTLLAEAIFPFYAKVSDCRSTGERRIFRILKKIEARSDLAQRLGEPIEWNVQNWARRPCSRLARLLNATLVG